MFYVFSKGISICFQLNMGIYVQIIYYILYIQRKFVVDSRYNCFCKVVVKVEEAVNFIDKGRRKNISFVKFYIKFDSVINFD